MCLFVACGARTRPGDAVFVAPIDASSSTAPRVFHGRVEVHYYPDAGEVVLDKDLSSSTVALYVHGQPISGAGNRDGTFQISGAIGDGPYTLRVDDEVLIGVADGVVLSQHLAGRPDRDRSAPPPMAQFDLTGLAARKLDSPFAAWVELASSNAGCMFISAESMWAPLPSATDTTALGAGAQLQGNPPCQLDASRGDQTTLMQFTRDAPDAGASAVRAADLGSWSSTGNPPVEVSAKLSPVTSRTLSGVFLPGSFLPALFVAGGSTSVTLSVAERPSVSPYAAPYVGLASYSGEDGAFALTFGDPLPTWTKIVIVDASTDFPIAMPGSSGTFPARLAVSSTREYAWVAQGNEIAIALSPPRNVHVGDAQPFEPATAVGTTPTLTWSRPDYAPTGVLRYEVSLDDLSASPADVPTLWTVDTSLTVPPGLLASGRSYAPRVTAHWSSDPVDFANRPFDAYASENATAPGGVFAP